MAEVRTVFPEKKIIQTSIGKVDYDYLVFAAGTTTNFYGNQHIAEEAIPMKNVSEAMGLQNAILSNLERSITCATELERQELLNVVIVGGGNGRRGGWRAIGDEAYHPAARLSRPGPHADEHLSD